MFPAKGNSTLLSQLTAKGYEYEQEQKFHRRWESVVYVLEDTKIVGQGVCMRAASVLVHKDIIGNEEYPVIYILEKKLKATTVLSKIENDIALLLVRNNHFY